MCVLPLSTPGQCVCGLCVVCVCLLVMCVVCVLAYLCMGLLCVYTISSFYHSPYIITILICTCSTHCTYYISTHTHTHTRILSKLSTSFLHRNKLFRHIEATGHAVLLLTPSLPTPSHSSSSQHKPRRKRTGKK